ncbi:MAG: tRNA (adenosine(37)-N6)-dimethylallyltransferase MiaA [Bacteroidales bacterium]|nr:tRNA (adenosine(37)-N6)-dimethylallyltransferase MiaA [Bacteroidales bacterium]
MTVDLITVLGPTATGKTSFGVALTALLNGEIISADSRQVYKGMDIGTGKDLNEYHYMDQDIPYHMIDIVEPGYEYNVFEFQNDFLKVYEDIKSRERIPVLCGGTGMYIESVLKGYKLIPVPEDIDLRLELQEKEQHELVEILATYKDVHNTTDTDDRERLVRAIEIQKYYKEHTEIDTSFPTINSVIFGIQFDRQEIRSRITQRLVQRLEEGMIEEVRGLMNNGLKAEQLRFYGLEYKYVTDHIIGKIGYNEMFKLLNTAIHQFAKRQMTWFKRMQKQGVEIHWIDGKLPLDKKLNQALMVLNQIAND